MARLLPRGAVAADLIRLDFAQGLGGGLGNQGGGHQVEPVLGGLFGEVERVFIAHVDDPGAHLDVIGGGRDSTQQRHRGGGPRHEVVDTEGRVVHADFVCGLGDLQMSLGDLFRRWPALADGAMQAKMRELVAPAEAIFLDVKFEAELIEVDEDDAAEMLADAGIEASGLEQLAKAGYEALGLQSYLTAGPKETRAWTIKQGATAPEAAGVIHTDFQRGFIRAEVVSFDDLIAAGSMQAVKAAGRVRLEGKEYIMQDGDVVEFRFNV